MANGDEPAVPVIGGQQMLYYFSSSMWCWRGMVELGTLLADYPAVVTPDAARLASDLLAEAPRLKADIDAAVSASCVTNASGHVTFVPAAVAPTGTKPTPYASMTTDTLASYSNFRYYAEMLSSGALDAPTATALMDFREEHGGTLSGMTRYSDHLDDMPADGYAVGALEADRLQSFLLLLYGHAANYQGRGSFFSTEQQSLYADALRTSWRASLGEVQADFCVPSQTLVALMTALQLVSAERDAPTIFLARGAPRRWYEGDGTSEVAFGVSHAPSRWGLVNFSISTPARSVDGKTHITVVNIAVDFAQPDGAQARSPTLMLRVRDPNGNATLSGAVVEAHDECAVREVWSATETIVVIPTPRAHKAKAVRTCVVIVQFVASK